MSMTDSLAAHEAAARRRLILDALAQDANYSITHMVLISLLGEYGYASADARLDLDWLQKKSLIRTDMIGIHHDLPQSTITEMGEDVAHGRRNIDGVRRHRPA